jgi:hypothetical protein
MGMSVGCMAPSISQEKYTNRHQRKQTFDAGAGQLVWRPNGHLPELAVLSQNK